MDICLYPASQPGRSGVLASETRLGGRYPDASSLIECICARSSQPGHDVDPVRGALFRAGVLPEKTFDILIPGCPVRHPRPGRADREHPPAYFYRSNPDKEDWSTAAGYVAYFAEKDDLVLFISNFVEIPFDYYFKPYEKQYSLQVVKHGVPLDLFDSGILEPKMTDSDLPRLISLLSGHNRVWLVYSHDSYTDPMGLIPQTLASQMKLIRTRDFYGGQVQLYGPP